VARVKERMSRKTSIHGDMVVLKAYEWTDFIKRNLQQVVVVVLVAVGAVAAGFGWSYYKDAKTDEAGRVLAPGNTAAAQARYSDAIPIFERVKNTYEGGEAGMEATISLAHAYFQTGKHEEARRIYQEFLDTYANKDDLLTIAATSGLASCDEQAGKFEEAAKQYEILAQDHTGGFLAPKFLLDAARCYQAANQTEQARKLYNQVVEQYKKSAQYVREAKNALAAL